MVIRSSSKARFRTVDLVINKLTMDKIIKTTLEDLKIPCRSFKRLSCDNELATYIVHNTVLHE